MFQKVMILIEFIFIIFKPPINAETCFSPKHVMHKNKTQSGYTDTEVLA